MMMLMAAGLLASPCLFAAGSANLQSLDKNGNGQFDQGEVDPCKEYSAGPCTCYCPVTKFVPQYYQTCRCEYEPYCVQRKCYRDVPQYYTKTFCRKVWIPEYYTQTYCKNCKECYYVTDTKYRPRYCYDQHCRYVPCTYVKSCCADNPCGTAGAAPCGTGCSQS